MCVVFFASRRRHTRCALVTGVQTWLFRSVDAQPERVDGVEAADPGPEPAVTTQGGTPWRMLAMVIASLALLAAIGTRWSQRHDVQPIAVIDLPALDRKRVVSGKSVYARVGLGGRRIIKKKKNKQHVK